LLPAEQAETNATPKIKFALKWAGCSHTALILPTDATKGNICMSGKYLPFATGQGFI
jgi:hypothetical protein